MDMCALCAERQRAQALHHIQSVPERPLASVYEDMQRSESLPALLAPTEATPVGTTKAFSRLADSLTQVNLLLPQI